MTKRKISVSAAIALSFLAYNLKRVMSILGNQEILRRLRKKESRYWYKAPVSFLFLKLRSKRTHSIDRGWDRDRLR